MWATRGGSVSAGHKHPFRIRRACPGLTGRAASSGSTHCCLLAAGAQARFLPHHEPPQKPGALTPASHVMRLSDYVTPITLLALLSTRDVSCAACGAQAPHPFQPCFPPPRTAPLPSTSTLAPAAAPPLSKKGVKRGQRQQQPQRPPLPFGPDSQKLLEAWLLVVPDGATRGMEGCQKLLSHKWRLLDWIQAVPDCEQAPRDSAMMMLDILARWLLPDSPLCAAAAKEVRDLGK
jgi:hypothetical protein